MTMRGTTTCVALALVAAGRALLQQGRMPRGPALRLAAGWTEEAPPPPVGAIRSGAVTRLESYGAFVRLEDGVTGLVHISALSQDRVRHPEDVVAVGQPVTVQVLRPKEPGKASFSLKAVDQRTGRAAAAVTAKRPAARRAATSAKVSLDDCAVSYSRASGAGGQHVNKVSTKCELRFNVDRGGALPEAVREELRRRHGSRISKGGDLIVASDVHRTQRLNAADALARLQGFVDGAVDGATPRETRPDKKKRIKRLARGSERRRRDEKQRASAKKAARRRPRGGDD